MACNEEKVWYMLNRFMTFKNEEKKNPKERHSFIYCNLVEATNNLRDWMEVHGDLEPHP
jgi:hypothetical protein